MTMAAGRAPGLSYEKKLWGSGADVVVGMDEVGRGAWAGPLTIAAVVIPRDRRVYGIRDSKQVTELKREKLFDRIQSWCESVGVGHASHEECDDLGMSDAQRLAGQRAIESLGVDPHTVLIDGSWDFLDGHRTQLIVKGDATCLSIAAASMIAKVTRDRIMRSQAESFPGFDFERNKGYPCPRHKVALMGYGATSIHRRSWAFMDRVPWSGQRREPVSSQGILFRESAPSS